MNGEEVEYWYEDGRLLYEKRGTDKEFYYSYDGYGNLSCIRYFLNGAQYTYYFLTNARGDVELIYGGSGVVLARYTYDSWGNTISIKDGDGEEITDPTNIALLNPIRYRGYYYDSETGLYYLQSRYYDPTTCRFVNADGYVSTGQGLLSSNMFAYCGNNPVNRSDTSGQFWITAVIVTAVVALCAVTLSGCSTEKTTPEPYNSPDEAAKAFSEEVYSASLYIRHEYSTEIYSRTINGKTTYNYNPPRSGTPHSVSVGRSTPKGTKTVAYAHTHPNSNSFSDADIRVANHFGIDAYVVGPNLNLQRYNLTSATTTSLGIISPIALTDEQRAALVSEFRISWDNHVTEGCDFNCGGMEWPTP